MKIQYINKRFNAAALLTIDAANTIIAEYQAQGFDLTLRQLYYQFVSRDLIPNSQKEYKKLGNVISDARLGGLISWEAIVDRTRNLAGNSHWGNPSDIIEACARDFQIDKWTGQKYRPEVWIEKDALVGVIEPVCAKNDVNYFSCRGYTSQSEMWAAGMRLKRYFRADQIPLIIHLGDHDPSGKDMTRDIVDRLELFIGRSIEVQRIALNYDQIEKYEPPPNPAKVTDPRAGNYIKEFGRESWELDALDPKVIDELITNAIWEVRDTTKWNKSVAIERKHIKTLEGISKKLAKGEK